MIPVIAQADRASWQRQAAAELARILEGHPELPCIAWTVGPASSVLIGRVSGLGPAPQVRQVFAAWLSCPTVPGQASVRMLIRKGTGTNCQADQDISLLNSRSKP